MQHSAHAIDSRQEFSETFVTCSSACKLTPSKESGVSASLGVQGQWELSWTLPRIILKFGPVWSWTWT